MSLSEERGNFVSLTKKSQLEIGLAKPKMFWPRILDHPRYQTRLTPLSDVFIDLGWTACCSIVCSHSSFSVMLCRPHFLIGFRHIGSTYRQPLWKHTRSIHGLNALITIAVVVCILTTYSVSSWCMGLSMNFLVWDCTIFLGSKIWNL